MKDHRHRMLHWPFGQAGQPDDCQEPFHSREDGPAEWRCECGYRICDQCLKMMVAGSSPRLVITEPVHSLNA